MATREIKSADGVTSTSFTLDGHSDSIQRKKLGNYFIESDDRCTAFGRGYTGGTTPVNIRGKPIADLSKTGGWIAAFFIFGTHFFFLLFFHFQNIILLSIASQVNLAF